MEKQGLYGGRLLYADFLRITATAAVITIHVAASMWLNCEVSTVQWRVMCFFNSFCRWAVPVFVMLSGMFFLDPSTKFSVWRLYSARILRIVCALLFWAAAYALFPSFLDFVCGRGVNLSDVSGSLSNVFLGGRTRYHLWFLYVIIGLYIITPPLRIFTAHAGRRDMEYFLLLCFLFVCVFRFIGVLFPDSAFSRFIGYMQVDYVMGYTGFYVAGYYLKIHGSGKFSFVFAMLLGAAGLFATFAGTLMLSLHAGKPVSFLLSYFSPNVAITSVAVFLLFRRFGGCSSLSDSASKAVSSLSGCTFGIYLVHDMFISVFVELGITTLSFNTLVAVPCISAMVLVLSLFSAALIKKIPVLGRLVL